MWLRWLKNVGIAVFVYVFGVLVLHWPKSGHHAVPLPAAFLWSGIALPVILGWMWWKDRPPKV